MPKPSQDAREIWNRRYADTSWQPNPVDTWLQPWLPALAPSRDRPLLELGCGGGVDTAFLVANGFRVMAADFAWNGLCQVQSVEEAAMRVQLDLRGGLPFCAGAFQGVVASLCLHYFSWTQTQAIVDQLHSLLRPSGVLLLRVNSTNDLNHGAGAGELVEPGYYLVNGRLKRFFSEADLRQFFQAGWRVEYLTEKTIQRYQQPKVVWEAVIYRL